MKLVSGRVRWLDGVRGLTALYVLLYHIVLTIVYTPFRTVIPPSYKWFGHGRDAVILFIALSGYSLMLRVAQTGTFSLRDYATRRAIRILPTYYAAIILSLTFFVLVPRLSQPTGYVWDIMRPALNWGSIITHLLLVHSLFGRYIISIDSPLWSVGTEWLIYWIFPLLLFARRRAGNLAPLALAALIAACATPLVEGAPWFVFTFACGMLAATAVTSGQTSRRRYVYGLIVLATGFVAFRILLSLAFYGMARNLHPVSVWSSLVEPVGECSHGLAMALGLLLCGLAQHTTHRWNPLRLLSAMSWLGSFSYSLYVIHFPVICALRVFIGESAGSRLPLIMFCIGIPASYLAAYVLYVIVERPTTIRRDRSTGPSLTDSLDSKTCQTSIPMMCTSSPLAVVKKVWALGKPATEIGARLLGAVYICKNP